MKQDPELERRMMLRALTLARRGQGRVEPNPMVGCVIAQGDRILGEGYHQRFGAPHAEVNALLACRKKPRGATAYVTLEPCCHDGKTPPCTQAIIKAGIARVVAALPDPHPLVDGGGFKQLKEAGVAVEVGLCASEAADLLAPFLTRIVLHRPYVIAKWAQSLDGKLATPTGASKWISSQASRRIVHQLRARVDAVIVGANTALADDPRLTARDVPLRRKAARIVLDATLRLSPRARLVQSARQVPTLVCTTQDALTTHNARTLEKSGVELVPCKTRNGSVSLRDLMKQLAGRDMTNVLVEGGPTVLTSLFEAKLVDEAWVFTAPRIIGGTKAPTAIGGRGSKTPSTSITPRRVQIRRIGDDILHRLWFTEPPRSRSAR
jgi:diaminohydroxyphosphoribosylaminopyrimidine deaminase / 5-amino-6-(5-phosphoribosylamino)uracil reductase